LNNFGRGPPGDHFCEVWLKSNEWLQRRSRLNEKSLGTHSLMLARTHALTDDGQRTVTIETKNQGKELFPDKYRKQQQQQQKKTVLKP